jgi:hypothetical protein
MTVSTKERGWSHALVQARRTKRSRVGGSLDLLEGWREGRKESFNHFFLKLGGMVQFSRMKRQGLFGFQVYNSFVKYIYNSFVKYI